jgi:serine/threonine protein kinase
VKKPNLCIVTEFVQQGSLRDMLANRGIKLPWQQRLSMLRSAAQGVSYLHSLQPTAVIHRDLKSSNLLVDENMNIKVADFGFARLKEENATMTRCGTPCWTAPEIIRGERYSEKADVYSFGIIMWEVLTRRTPFAGLYVFSHKHRTRTHTPHTAHRTPHRESILTQPSFCL